MPKLNSQSRPINLHRQPIGEIRPVLYDKLDDIQSEIETWENRQNRRGEDVKEHFRDCIRAICIDLCNAYALSPELEVGVSQDNTTLSNNPSYPTFVTRRPFIAALNGLQALGYVNELIKGSEASGKSTRIQATPKLMEKLRVVGQPDSVFRYSVEDTSDAIRVQTKIKVGGIKRTKRHPFIDTPEVRQWRHNLHQYNEHIEDYHLTLDATSSEYATLEAKRRIKARHEAKDYCIVDDTRTRLYRVFNSDDFTLGGRYYGGWWQSIPREFRPLLKINGKDTCEVDFSSMHARLLYREKGIKLSSDFDPYSKPFGRSHRKAVKKAFNVMLNANRRIRKESVPEFSVENTGMSWKDFLEGIIRTHEPIKEYFYTGAGLRLQRKESDIAEAIMLKYVNMGYPCLPIHDSFITFATLKDEVSDTIQQVTNDLIGTKIPMAMKKMVTYTGPSGLVEASIGEMLDSVSESERYKLKRLE